MNERSQSKHNSSRLGRTILAIVIILVVTITSLFIPWNLGELSSHPHPAQSYDEAVQRIQALDDSRTAPMNPDCTTQFLTHGKKVEHVIVLVHGYTNCPAQFRELGQQFYDLGYNVLIAPIPRHGLADRMTEEQALMTAKEVAQYADEMTDIAQGLGDHVSMMGFSLGGITTAWAAQNRSDIDLAVIISPAFGFKQIPTPLTVPVMNFYLLKPNSYVWWDPALQTETKPDHAYPRYSMRALAQLLRLGFSVQTSARHTAPAAKQVIMVTNANDTSVNNELISQVVTHWQEDGADVKTYEFPASLGLEHDMIDPDQPNQNIDVVYPQLIELATQ